MHKHYLWNAKSYTTLRYLRIESEREREICSYRKRLKNVTARTQFVVGINTNHFREVFKCL